MAFGRLTPSPAAALLVAAVLLSACTSAPPRVELGAVAGGLAPPEDFTRLPGVVDLASLDRPPDALATWQEAAPAVQDVRITSSADGSAQPALYLAPDGDGDRPLLVVLHSWSARYVQGFGAPYAAWADQEGWAMVAPDFRGSFDRPEATGSDLAVADVLDAVAYAVEQGGVDEDRVFLVGFSGGGMMSLLVAARHPDRFAGAVSWVPVHDLVDWYAYNREQQPGSGYADEIAASCGGDPTSDDAARQDCLSRSPRSYVERLREAGVPVYVGHGLQDTTVPADAAVRAYDDLADPADRLGDEVAAAVREGRLPSQVPGEPAESFFAPQDPPVLLARRSGDVTLVLFEGEHDTVFHPGLAFLSAVAQRD